MPGGGSSSSLQEQNQLHPAESNARLASLRSDLLCSAPHRFLFEASRRSALFTAAAVSCFSRQVQYLLTYQRQDKNELKLNTKTLLIN